MAPREGILRLHSVRDAGPALLSRMIDGNGQKRHSSLCIRTSQQLFYKWFLKVA